MNKIQLECSFIESSYLHIIDYTELQSAKEMRDKYDEQLEYLWKLQFNIDKLVNISWKERFEELEKELFLSECKLHLSYCSTMKEKQILCNNSKEEETYLLNDIEINNSKNSEESLILHYNKLIKNRQNSKNLTSTEGVIKDLSIRIKSGEWELTKLMSIVFYLYSYSESSDYDIWEELPVIIHDRKFDENSEFDMNLEASRFIRMWGRKNVNSKIIQNKLIEHISELRDIKKQLEIKTKQLQIQATTDPLTGLKNRWEIDKLFKVKYNNVQRLWAKSWYVIFDLDWFKDVNDNLGHHSWDEILQVLSNILQSHFKRPEDVIWRLGWDEFILIIDGEQNHIENKLYNLWNDINIILNNILSIQNYNKNWNKNIQITSSMWIMNIQTNDSIQEIMKKSDTALYEVKNSWKNWYLFSWETLRNFEEIN